LTRMDGLGSIRQLARKIGRIAQLEERCPYKAEVTGSIPVPPTTDTMWIKTVTAAINILSIESSAIGRVTRGRRSAWFRTPDCQSGGRGFKSRRPRHVFRLALTGRKVRPAAGRSRKGRPFPGTETRESLCPQPSQQKQETSRRHCGARHVFRHLLNSKAAARACSCEQERV
jgi:hypothetical protein